MKHGDSHNLKDKHNIFLIKNFDSFCIEHNGNTVINYCPIHNKNYCVRCSHFFENNKKIDEELDDEFINYYENEMKKNEENIKNIDYIFDNYKKLFKDFENNLYIFKNNINKKLTFMKEIIDFYKRKKTESDINYQMKANIENNYFDLSQITQKIKNKLNNQTKEINELIELLKKNEIKNNIKEDDKFKNFKIENMKNIKTLKIIKELFAVLKH